MTPQAIERNQQPHTLPLKGAISALYYYGFALLIAQQYGGNCCYRLHQNCIYNLSAQERIKLNLSQALLYIFFVMAHC